MNVEQYSDHIKKTIDEGVIVTPFARGTRDTVFFPYPDPTTGQCEQATGHPLGYVVSNINDEGMELISVVVGDRHRIVMINGEFVDREPDEDDEPDHEGDKLIASIYRGIDGRPYQVTHEALGLSTAVQDDEPNGWLTGLTDNELYVLDRLVFHNDTGEHPLDDDDLRRGLGVVRRKLTDEIGRRGVVTFDGQTRIACS